MAMVPNKWDKYKPVGALYHKSIKNECKQCSQEAKSLKTIRLNHGCWCPGDVRSQGISSRDIKSVPVNTNFQTLFSAWLTINPLTFLFLHFECFIVTTATILTNYLWSDTIYAINIQLSVPPCGLPNTSNFTTWLFVKQPGRSPNVVTFFSATNFSS